MHEERASGAALAIMSVVTPLGKCTAAPFLGLQSHAGPDVGGLQVCTLTGLSGLLYRFYSYQLCPFHGARRHLSLTCNRAGC